MVKRIVLFVILLIGSLFTISFASPPNFEGNKGKKVGYNLSRIRKDASLENNIRNIFFPDFSMTGGIIWYKLRYIAVGLLFVFLIWGGALLVLDAANDGELKKAKLNIVYIMYGAFLVFGSIFLLGSILHVGQSTTISDDVIVGAQRDILGRLVIFLKAAAYYIAVLMMVYYGYRIVHAQEKDDKIKAGKTGVLNIIIALIAIKVLDYVYYIVQQSHLKDKLGNLLVGAGKALGWALGVLIIVALIYAATLLITSRGEEEAWKKSKIIIRNVFLVIVIVFLFIVIVYDLIRNFAA